MDIKKMGICEKIINMVLDVIIFIFGIILLISIYNSIQVKLLGNDYSSFFGYTIFEVQTGSMADAINAGDWIIVKSDSKIELNDVVTFEQDGEFVTHRVIEKYKGTYITKGDANNTKDDPITKEQIIGRVVKVLPHFGIFRKTIFNPIVLLALIITLYICSITFKKKNSEVKSKTTSIEKVFSLEKIKKHFNDMIEKKIQEKQRELETEEIEEKKEEKSNKKKVSAVKKNDKKEKEVTNKIENDEKEEKIEEVKFVQVNEAKEDEKIDLSSTEIISEEEFDKTMYFRAITVDKDEIDKTFLEIKKNKELEKMETLKEKEKEEAKLRKKEEKNIISLKEEKSETILKEALELMQLKIKKKFNNVIEKVMYIKEQELNDIIEVISRTKDLAVNEASIKNAFIDMFIDVKYYNRYINAEIEYNGKNMTTRVLESINELQEILVKKYKGSDTKYELKVKKYSNIFILIMYLEQAHGTIADINIVKEMYKKKLTKYLEVELSDEDIKKMINEIIKIQRLYRSMTNYTLEKLETKMFTLEYNQLSTRKNLYAIEMKHNINFSKVYSDYIVDKTYSEGIVAEDKMTILITLLSLRLANDMLNADFKNKYILYVPTSLYSKDNKLSQLSKVMNNEFIKNNVIILAKYNDFISNKTTIKGLKKEGYRFAIDFAQEVEIKAKSQSMISLADYVFIDKKNKNIDEILKVIPEELQDNVIQEDIGSKVGIYGGE